MTAPVYVTVTPDGGLTNVSATPDAAAAWCRCQDRVVRCVAADVLEVTRTERDALRAVLAEPMPAGRRAALESVLARMVVPLAIDVVVRK